MNIYTDVTLILLSIPNKKRRKIAVVINSAGIIGSGICRKLWWCFRRVCSSKHALFESFFWKLYFIFQNSQDSLSTILTNQGLDTMRDHCQIVRILRATGSYQFCFDYLSFHSNRAQMLMKSRLTGAQKGHGLLKKKADALQMRFRQILGKIIEVSTPQTT